MGYVTSRDGTTVEFDRTGDGPAVILVPGVTGVRTHPSTTDLAARLSERFTVFNYDRRGKGGSGDTPPYAVEREIEDIEAVIAEASGSACVYGISSGAILALEAAIALPARVARLALYEPPFIVDDGRPPLPADYVERLDAAMARGDRTGAVDILFTRAFGVPAEYLPSMRGEPWWAEMERVAHTIAYDGRIVGDTMSGKPLPAGRWAAATMPTLVLTGELSEPFFQSGADGLAAILPDARRQTLAGQAHDVAAEALAPVLVAFFAG